MGLGSELDEIPKEETMTHATENDPNPWPDPPPKK
jgi:hypothetical protein